MGIEDTSEFKSDNRQDKSEYFALIADESFDFRNFYFDDRKVTGGQLAEAIGAHPFTDFVVLQQLESMELEALRSTELADLTKSKRFFVIRGAEAYNFWVDGLSMVWPQKTIKGKYIKRLVGKDNDSIELLLKHEDVPDEVIGDEYEVPISNDGAEEFKTRPVKSGITIVVEGTPHKWYKESISYDEVVTLEVPDYAQHSEITYSVKYKNGLGNKPEGALAKGASVKVKDGMIFSVSETGQS